MELHDAMRLLGGERRPGCLMVFLLGHGGELVDRTGMHGGISSGSGLWWARQELWEVPGTEG